MESRTAIIGQHFDPETCLFHVIAEEGGTQRCGGHRCHLITKSTWVCMLMEEEVPKDEM